MAGGKKIYRVDVEKTFCYVFAENKRQAKIGTSRSAVAREWDICMGPRHGEVPGTDVYPRPKAKFIGKVDGRQAPLCEFCNAQLSMTVEERLDRLERLVAELRRDLTFHEDNHEG